MKEFVKLKDDSRPSEIKNKWLEWQRHSAINQISSCRDYLPLSQGWYTHEIMKILSKIKDQIDPSEINNKS